MKAVLQRVTSASVTVDQQLISSIGRGILVFAAVGKEDTEKDADSLASKILKVKLWPDETSNGSWKRSVQDIQGEVLCVSQFTLLAQIKKGNKPDFHNAADIESARKLYDYFFRRVRDLYHPERVKNGVFQAMMEVELKNDGPVGLDYRSDDAAVTIEVNTNLPKPEPKGPGTSSESSSNGKGKGEQANGDSPGGQIDNETQGRQVYEFKFPPSLLE
ncbi:hypothetical protein Egran_02973 [Elaphomyces granulatus]|uniref:D-aminoacyl-tRNA deacylase n=1 Tax=Elaphomyces granulatus TaxID=519963 RepID=A0A232LYR5_9EURO|nr:hypothetical protein Egran_02973 [Elaphomyces granulatus]